jgi:hypothetical protein
MAVDDHLMQTGFALVPHAKDAFDSRAWTDGVARVDGDDFVRGGKEIELGLIGIRHVDQDTR